MQHKSNKPNQPTRVSDLSINDCGKEIVCFVSDMRLLVGGW